MATVSHKLELPDGTVPHRAKVAVRLIASTDPFDTEEGHVAGQYSIGGITRPPIDSTGTWTLNLTPNATIIPAGTVYEVVEQLPGFDEVTLYFSVPNGGGQVQDLLTDFPGTLPSGATAAETARATAAELALTNSKVDAVTAGDATITIGGTSRAPTVAVNVIGEGKVTNLIADLAAKIATATLGQALGPASLDGAGKLLTTQLPSLAITDVSVVASAAAMLAIAGAHQGSVAVRTDIQNQAFMHNAGTSGTLADWTEIGFGDVLSVNGATGAVTITAAGLGALVAASNLSDLPSPTTAKANLGLSNVDNTSDVNKPVSTAQATADALRIPLTQKGAASGVGTLDSGGHQPLSELSSQVVSESVDPSGNLGASKTFDLAGKRRGLFEGTLDVVGGNAHTITVSFTGSFLALVTLHQAGNQTCTLNGLTVPIPLTAGAYAFWVWSVDGTNTFLNLASGTAGPAGSTGPTGLTGQGFNFRGPWAALTVYNAFDVVTSGGSVYEADHTFTSGASFNAANWNLWAQKGDKGDTGAPGSLIGYGVDASKPSVGTAGDKGLYYSQDVHGGALEQVQSGAWTDLYPPDQAATVPSPRTLGTSAVQAAAGNDGRWARNAKTAWAPTNSIAETFSRSGARIENSTGLQSGRLYLVGGLILPGGVPVATLTMFSGVTAAGTPLNQWFCLIALSNLAVLGKTADDTTTAWAASSPKSLALSATYTPSVDIAVYFGIVVVATTVPTFMGSDTGIGSTVVPGTAPLLNGLSTSSLTTPASLGGTAGVPIAANYQPYAYVS